MNSLTEKLLNGDFDSNNSENSNRNINNNFEYSNNNQYIEFKNEIQKNNLSDNNLRNIYNYYIYNGYFTILSIQVIKLLSSGFLVFLLIFLTKCINYNKLKKMENTTNINNFISLNQLIKFNNYENFLSIILTIYFLLRVTVVINDFIVYYNIKTFYKKKLEFKDLLNIEWSNISEKIKNLYGNKYNVYNINSRILKKENFLILLSKTNLGNFIFSKLIQINIMECIINNIVKIKRKDIIINNGDIQFLNKKELFNKSLSKILFISLLIFISMPVLIIYIMFFSFLKYGEKFYNEPNKLFYKQLSNNSNNKLRYYNEFKVDFLKRNNVCLKYCKEYLDLFSSNYIKIILKFITFILSSIFIILLCLTIYNENILLKLNITDNRPVIWYLGLFGSIIAILKNVTKENKDKNKNKKELLDKIIQYNKFLDIEEDDKINIKGINKNLKYQLVVLFTECFSVLLVPFYLIYLCNYLENIILFLENNSYYDENIGAIVKQSNFRDLTSNSDKDSLISFAEFRNKYPNWGANIEIYQIGNTSVLNKEKVNNYTLFDDTIESNISII